MRLFLLLVLIWGCIKLAPLSEHNRTLISVNKYNTKLDHVVEIAILTIAYYLALNLRYDFELTDNQLNLYFKTFLYRIL